MKIIIRVALVSIAATGTGISHDGRTTSGLPTGSWIGITTAATVVGSHSMLGRKLMPDLMCDHIVKHRTGRSAAEAAVQSAGTTSFTGTAGRT
ncbi:hypothetical protein D3C86_1530970 [compost metagenome]